ncbi:hypothetical protein JHK87_052361 [Glycine soja]|nr:hypothetical protein JHK87_052361 [Glycine soja]
MFRISKMHARGSNFGNSYKQTPGSSSSFVPNHPLQRDFDLRHQNYIRNQARSNGRVPEPAFQNVAGPITIATDYCAMAVDSKNGFPNGGLSYSSIVPQPVFSPDNHPSIATCTDLDVLPNSFVSGWRSNPKASSKSVSSYFPQRQAYDCMFI